VLTSAIGGFNIHKTVLFTRKEITRWLMEEEKMDNVDIWERAERLLIFVGIALFLAGLLTGFAMPLMENPRVGLSSHLEGVLNGVFLIALGSVWKRIGLVGRSHSVAFGLVLFGTVANWLATLLAGLWGTGAMMPIAAAGRSGTALQETVVTILLYALSLAMVAACAAFLFGSRRKIVDEGGTHH
jgi:hydroxylaminobenzene mutase